jgi:hypothetical protein
MLRALMPLLRLARFGIGPAHALVNLAESWVGTVEKGQNQGAEVEHWIKLAGGRPQSAPPWCAYFVSAMCETVERVGFPVRYVKTGRAVAHWQLAEPDQRIDRDAIDKVADVRGLVFVRTRKSRPVSDRLRALEGKRVQGHTGIVIRREGSELVCVAGNSTGEGHASRTGGVAFERIKPGTATWDRVVGFVRVALP